MRLTKEEEEPVTDESSNAGEGQGDEMIALAFGSLINGPNGTTRYLGPSTASGWLFQVNAVRKVVRSRTHSLTDRTSASPQL